MIQKRVFQVGVLSLIIISVGYMQQILSIAQSNKSEFKYGIPKLNPYEIWVSSVPLGARVYHTDEIFYTNQHMTYIHPLSKHTQATNFIGRTPIILDLTKVKRYIVFAFYPDKFKLFESKYLGFATNSIDITKQGSSHSNEQLGLVYDLNSPKQKKNTLIGLFQTSLISLDDFSFFYPSGNNFLFDEDELKNRITELEVAKQDIDKAIELLHRGGKVALWGGSGKIVKIVVVEITEGNKFLISTDEKW